MPCNGNGQCDLTIGVCNCDEGHQGSDCSGNTFDNENIFLAAGSRQVSSRIDSSAYWASGEVTHSV